MKKHGLFAAFLGLFMLFGCTATRPIGPSRDIDVKLDSEALGAFRLTNPKDGVSLENVPELTWEASSHADYYTLEIASTADFNPRLDTEVYYKKDYIQTNHYTISASLHKKDCTYYWKVTANNQSFTKLCEKVETFYLASPDIQEVRFDLGEPSDWSVHEEGTPCQVDIDTNNFFGNDEESVVVKFDIEHSKTIGWVVVSKTIEKDTYGTDSLFFRFYYSGDDAVAFVRVLDADGEYYRHKILLANNSKQTCIFPFSEFEQVTRSVVVNNKVFDYYHVRYFEIVFEQSFGDGVCLVSEVKAVKQSDYENMFIRKMDFRQFPTDEWVWEGGYNFGYDIDEEGTGYTLHYDTTPNEYNEKGIGSYGYGFTKIIANRFFVGGNVLRMKVKYTGTANPSISFRIYEEDTDRWAYQQAFSTLKEGEFTEILIPFEAFSASYLGGNGRRELSFIINLQFGLTNVYGAGTLTYKDVEIVYRDNVEALKDNVKHVGNDGMIDDFDSYLFPAQPFYKWSMSTENKDEFISLDKLNAYGSGNVYAGTFTYKADMAPAQYQIPLSFEEGASFNAVSIWLKDNSVLSLESAVSYLKEVSASCTIGFYTDMGITYTYTIDALPKVWTLYEIPFSALKRSSGIVDLELSDIAYFGMAFTYHYYTQDGQPFPTYAMQNPVYADNIRLTNADEVLISTLEKAIVPDQENENQATLDDCESYPGGNPLSSWSYVKEHEANSITLSDDVSSSGGNHSIKMNYKGATSVSYALGLTMDSSISDTLRPKGLVLDIKGDGKATVYVNIYAVSGTSTMQVRKNILSGDLKTGWARYQIGFGQFTDYMNPSTAQINANNAVNIYQVTIGIVNTDSSASSIYVDNLRLSNEFSRSTYNITAL